MSVRRELHSDSFDYCRLCMYSPETDRLVRFYDIFQSFNQLKELSQLIQDFYQVVIKEDDELPKIICDECCKFLLKSEEKKKIAAKTQVLLQYIKIQNDTVTHPSNYSPSVDGTIVSADSINSAPSTSHDSIILPPKQSTITKTIIRKSTTVTTIISRVHPNIPGQLTTQPIGQICKSDEDNDMISKDIDNFYCLPNQIITTCLVPNCYVVCRTKKDILPHYRQHMVIFSRAKLCYECTLSDERNIDGLCNNHNCGSYKSVIYKTLKCFECNILFNTMLELTEHKVNSHICILKTNEGKYECLQCKISCDNFMLIETHLMFCIRKHNVNFNFTTYN